MSDRERLEDLAISEALGRDTAPDLSGRILGAIDGGFADTKTPRRGVRAVRSIQTGRRFTERVASHSRWRSVAVVSVVMLTIGMGLVIYASQVEPSTNKAVEIAEDSPALESGESNREMPAEKPETRPTNPVESNSVDEPTAHTNPETTPPDAFESELEDYRQPERSNPEPRDLPPKEPEPIAPQPEEVIESPPSDDKATEAETPLDRIRKRPVLANFKSAKNIQVTYEVDGREISLDDSTVRVGAKVKCTGRKAVPAILYWNSGAMTSFYGEFKVLKSSENIKLQLVSSYVYIDSLNSAGIFEIAVGKPGKEAVIEFDNSAVLIERMIVTCLSGQVRCGDSVLTSGQVAAASRKQKFGKPVDATQKLGSDKLLQNTPSRQIYYYDFESKRDNDYFVGEIVATDSASNGFAVVGAKRIGFNLPEQNHIVTPNETIRIRIRSTNCTRLVIHVFCRGHNDNYGFDVLNPKSDSWIDLVIPLSSMRGRADSKRLPSTGEVLTSLSILAKGTNTKIEIDTVSWTRSAVPSK